MPGFIGDLCQTRYTYKGCFRDGNPDVFQESVSMRGGIDWNNMRPTVDKCAREVKKRGFREFGIEYYGECNFNKTTGVNYDDYGVDTRTAKQGGCYQGTGPANGIGYYVFENDAA